MSKALLLGNCALKLSPINGEHWNSMTETATFNGSMARVAISSSTLQRPGATYQQHLNVVYP